MEVTIKGYDASSYVIEVGEDDTTETLRQKVASAAGLAEDSFYMGFGGKDEGDDITQLSAGDTVVITNITSAKKDDAMRALLTLGETRLTTQRLAQCLEDARLVHLLLQAEVTAVIHDGFLEDCPFQELDLSAVSYVTKVGDFFLRESCRATTVDLSGWNNVTHIGSAFLFSCTSLTTLDLSGWSSVTEIGHYFLRSCSALRTVDLSGWSNVSRIGDSFLNECFALTTLELSGWNNVTAIGHRFLYNCSALTELDLSGWGNVTQVGDCCFKECHALSTLRLSGWNNVAVVRLHFLSNCTSLTALDLSGWTDVLYVDTNFLSGCNLRTCSINVTGSSRVLLKRVRKARGKGGCVCM